jgi:hypothetical protein
MELATSNMLTPSQHDEWDQKVNASLQVKKNADDAEANASAVRKAERKRLKQEAKAEAEAKAKADAEAAEAEAASLASAARKAERKRLKQKAKADAEAAEAEAAEAEAASLASAARKAERKRLKQKAKADAEAAEAEAKSKAEAVTVTEAAEAEAAALASAARKAERKRLKQKAKADAEAAEAEAAEAEAASLASAARKAERKRLKQKAKADAEAADAEAKAKAEAVTVTAASTEAAALAQREAYANEDALQPAPLNEAERLVDLDNAIEAEAIVYLQEETVAKKEKMLNRIEKQGGRYGTAFEKVMLKYYQSELQNMVRTSENHEMTNFIQYDNGEKHALYDIVNNVCVGELKMFDSNGYRINVKTQTDIINELYKERDEIETQMREANGDVEIMKTLKEDYNNINKEINKPENYFKIQVTKFIGTGTEIWKTTYIPQFKYVPATKQFFLNDVLKNGMSTLKTKDVGLKFFIWTASGLYYYDVIDDLNNNRDEFNIKINTASGDHKIISIAPKFKTEISEYDDKGRPVKSYLIPISKLKFFKL